MSEIRTGVLVLFAFAVLVYASFKGIGPGTFQSSTVLTAHFDDVMGLVSGSPVWLSGIEVGRVRKIKFVEKEGVGKIRVDFRVRDNVLFLVKDDSKVSVGTMGLMGDKYLSVSAGSAGGAPVVEGMELGLKPSADMTTAFASAPEMMTDVSTTLDKLARVLERIESGEGIVGRLMSDSETSENIDSTITELQALLTDVRRSQKRLITSLERGSESIADLTETAAEGPGTVSKMLTDTTVYSNLESLSGRAADMMTRWDTQPGTFEKVMTDSSMYVEVRELIIDVRDLIDDIKANPRKYFKFSVF